MKWPKEFNGYDIILDCILGFYFLTVYNKDKSFRSQGRDRDKVVSEIINQMSKG